MDRAENIDDAIQPADPQTSHRLFGLGLVALILGIVFQMHESQLEDPLLMAMGALVMALSAVPALVWAKRNDAHFPSFEMFMLTAIPFYAMPLISGRKSFYDFTSQATWQAAMGIVLFQLAAIVTFLQIKGGPAKSPALTTTLLPEAAMRYAQVGLWLNTAYFYVQGFTDLIPYELTNTVRSTFFGIGTVALFILARRWGARQLKPGEKAVVVLNVAAQMILLFRDLYLIKGISIVLLAMIGYVSTSRRVPMLIIFVLLPILAVLHSGKSAMRKRYWSEFTPLPTVTELPQFFQAWVEFGLDPPEEKDESEASLAGKLFERASLFQMFCLVTERTPEYDPFLAGESYVYLPAQLIPSFLWPGKPSSMQSNILLAVHYHLLAADATASVSIAFGMIAEAFANFGIIGCAALGALLGYGYKRISVAALGSPQFSALGLLTILLAAWSFQVEQIFATWIVSLIQAAVVVVGVPIAFRILFRQN